MSSSTNIKVRIERNIPGLTILVYPNRSIMSRTALRYEMLETNQRRLKLSPSLGRLELKRTLNANTTCKAEVMHWNWIQGYALKGSTLASVFKAGNLNHWDRKLKALVKEHQILLKNQYIIITCKECYKGVIAHEISHFLFARVPEYRNAVLATQAEYDISPFKRGLKRIGYPNYLFRDETNAFMMVPSIEDVYTDLAIPEADQDKSHKKLHKALRSLYTKTLNATKPKRKVR